MRLYHIFKRGIDVIVSLIGIIVLIPVFLVIVLWVKSSSRGPAVYKHTRIGKDGKPFKIYKFRSMVVGAREMQNKGVPDDKLITFAGRFLRRSFLDETTQLFNVLKGEMSLIGPRPKDVEVFENLIKDDKKWKDIVKIKPGVTSLESVADYLSARGRMKFEKHFKGLLKKDDYNEKRDNYRKYYKHIYFLDKYYMDNESLFFDIKVLYFTFLLMMRRIFSKG
ncbi:sugar transferase [Candidatus Woesearchaeota archaeon]|nr:sugar transferase [Candidatus Woesearchaeota archaeon]